jgi:hypothetical protein
VGPGTVAAGEAINDAVARNLEALRQTYDCVLVCCDLPESPSPFARWLAGEVEPVVVVGSSEGETAIIAAAFQRVRPGRTRPLLMAWSRGLGLRTGIAG